VRETRPDRRAALKERHRAAILEAAAALMQEARGVAFSVDELAERADVSRRTVFNHFASLDDVVVTVCSEVLGGLVDTFMTAAGTVPSGDDSLAAMLDDLVHALRATDLVGPMAYLTRVVGGAAPDSPLTARVLQLAFADVTVRLAGAMATRHPDADPLDVDLLVHVFMGGLLVLNRHWSAEGAEDTPAARRRWSELVDRLVDDVRTGFGARQTPAAR